MADPQSVTLKADGLLEGGGDDPLGCLGCRVKLGAGCTLDSFFRLLDAYPVFLKLSTFLPSLRSRWRNREADGPSREDFEALELSKTVEMIGFPGRPRLEIYLSFHGRRGEETVEIRAFQWERLLALPLRLGRLRHVIFGDKVDVFEFETVYTLFEMIDGIGWELSFQSTPMQCELRR